MHLLNFSLKLNKNNMCLKSAQWFFFLIGVLILFFYFLVKKKKNFFLIAFLFLYWKDITILLSVFNLILSYMQKFYHKILNLNKYDNLHCTVGSEIPTVQ